MKQNTHHQLSTVWADRESARPLTLRNRTLPVGAPLVCARNDSPLVCARIFTFYFLLLTLNACSIKNDIEYPTVESQISQIEVEGITESATISAKNQTVTMTIDDTADLSSLALTKLRVTNDAEIIPDASACIDPDNFPSTSFTSLDELDSSADTRIDFTNPVTITLRTYQDYVWTVTVTQTIERDIQLQNQIGDAEIDETAHTVTIYVAASQDLSAIPVTTFNLAGEHGTVTPDPTTYDTYDFSTTQTFYATHAWETSPTTWTVNVLHADDDTVTATASIFTMATSAYLSGTISQSGVTPTIQYKTANTTSWTQTTDLTSKGTSFSATLTSLTPATDYDLRVTLDGETLDQLSFTTAPATALTNGSFENWSQTNGRWDPSGEDEDVWWSTGNAGSYSFIGNITTPTTESVRGYAVLMQTKWAAIKLASASIFAGTFELDGTNGILQMGRPFTTFPTSLKFYYQYEMAEIDHLGSSIPEWLETSKGTPDTCSVYIALLDSEDPYEIRTRPSTRKLFDPHDDTVIAYAQFNAWQSTTNGYQEITIPIEYYYTDRTPTYIMIVAAASKYGDYFVGGDGSTLYLDEMELIYE